MMVSYAPEAQECAQARASFILGTVWRAVAVPISKTGLAKSEFETFCELCEFETFCFCCAPTRRQKRELGRWPTVPHFRLSPIDLTFLPDFPS